MIIDNFSNPEKIRFSKQKEYDEEVIIWGAIFAAISKEKSGKAVNPEAINESLKNIQIEVFEAGDMVKSFDRSAMQSPDNYKYPDKFNEKDYMVLVQNLKRAYCEIDSKWQEYLTDHIPVDLNDPTVTFVVVKNKETNQMVGLCKIKPVPGKDNTYYFGTHYVEPEYQKGFDLGGYLEEIAKTKIPKGAHIQATVAAANSAMERHIERRNGIGIDVLFEEGDPKKSNELYKFEWNYDGNYVTKNTKIFSRERIKEIVDNGSTLSLMDVDAVVGKFDTRPEKNEDFIKTSREKFAKGYVLTRIFYSPDMSNTYVVYERKSSKVQQIAA